MHGLILVTFEKFVRERFGALYFQRYREIAYKLGGVAATRPLIDRVYQDELVVQAVSFVSEDTHVPLTTLLREYGHYFLLNGLTSRICDQILSQVTNARDLLLMMSQAHQQMKQASALLTPPLFGYEMISHDTNEFILIYQNERKLCPILHGAIEGAAHRYQQEVHLVEQTCMLQGAPSCRFHVYFGPVKREKQPSTTAHYQEHKELEALLLQVLPLEKKYALTLPQIMQALQGKHGTPRLFAIHSLLEQLIIVGYVASSAYEGDTLTNRVFWQVPRLNTPTSERSFSRYSNPL